MEILDQKKLLREKMLHIRKSLSLEYSKNASNQICHKIGELLDCNEQTIVAIYFSINNEVDLQELANIVYNANGTICYPYIKNDSLQFYKVLKGELPPFAKDPLWRDINHILDYTQIIDPEVIDVIITPLLAYDNSYYRLGYGKGFYDRFFKKYDTIPRLGVAFKEQAVNKLPTDKWDQPLDFVITN